MKSALAGGEQRVELGVSGQLGSQTAHLFARVIDELPWEHSRQLVPVCLIDAQTTADIRRYRHEPEGVGGA
jgi:hypothetical protein